MDLEKFNPTKAELQTLVDRYKNLTINGIEDKGGYATVNSARKDLKEKRVAITKLGKQLRDDANKFAKAVISKEKELVAIIEPLETKLSEQVAYIDNVAKLPERQARLKEIEVVGNSSYINLLSDANFEKYFNTENAAYLAKKAEELRLAQAKLDEDKRIAEAAKEAREQAEKQAQIEKEKLEKKIQEINEAKETEQRAKEQQEREAKEAEQQKIRDAEQQKIRDAKNKAYQEWLAENNVTEADRIERDGDSVKIYRLVAERTF